MNKLPNLQNLQNRNIVPSLINSLFSYVHLLINSNFLFNRLTSLKGFKSYNISVKHNLRTPPIYITKVLNH